MSDPYTLPPEFRQLPPARKLTSVEQTQLDLQSIRILAELIENETQLNEILAQVRPAERSAVRTLILPMLSFTVSE